MEVKDDKSLKKYTFLQVGGPAKYLAFPENKEDLKRLYINYLKDGLPFFILGKGSNLLVADQGFPGLVICTKRLNSTQIELSTGGDRLKTGAGVPISVLLKKASQEGWGGLEFLVGIPGSVGGAVFMNAGTHTGDVKNSVIETDVFSLQSSFSVTTFLEKELKFSYRKNHFIESKAIVLSAVWRIKKEDPAAIKKSYSDLLARRKKTQPVDHPSCGSVFKNPEETHAWKVIDELGLRGHRIGGAEFSDKHPNFIVNVGAAKAEDVKRLIDLAKAKAMSHLGIKLEEEVRLVGFT